MIESKFILDIIGATIAGEKHEEQIAKQLNHLEEVEYEHMDTGLILFLDPSPAIQPLTDEQLTDTFGKADHELAKVELIKEDQKIHADVSVHFSNGIIDRIEIWNKKGDYPEDDLESWELNRINK
jgi:hypothetical protein